MRDDRVAEQVVELSPHGSVDLRSGIPDRPVHEIQLGIVRAGQPHRAAAQLPAVAQPGVVAELAGPRHRVPAPQLLAGGRVVGVEESARAELAAGDADEHLVFHDERRARQAVAEHRVRDLRLPERQSGSGVERDERGVERADEQAGGRAAPRRG